MTITGKPGQTSQMPIPFQVKSGAVLLLLLLLLLFLLLSILLVAAVASVVHRWAKLMLLGSNNIVSTSAAWFDWK